MKRTVMVEILSDKLNSLLSDVYFEKISTQHASNIILTACEQAGMLPPEVKCPVLFRVENKWEE